MRYVPRERSEREGVVQPIASDPRLKNWDSFEAEAVRLIEAGDVHEFRYLIDIFCYVGNQTGDSKERAGREELLGPLRESELAKSCEELIAELHRAVTKGKEARSRRDKGRQEEIEKQRQMYPLAAAKQRDQQTIRKRPLLVLGGNTQAPQVSIERYMNIPKRSLDVRFISRDSFVPRNENEIIRHEDGRTNFELPDMFLSSYFQEACVFGLLKIASTKRDRILQDGVEFVCVDLKGFASLCRAIGLKLRPNRHFQHEKQVWKAFEELRLYRHPFIMKRQARNDGKTEILIAFRPLFELYSYKPASPETLMPIARLQSDGGQTGTSKLINMKVLLHPSFFPPSDSRNFRKLDFDLFEHVERTIGKLAAKEGKRAWRAEPAYLAFPLYLMWQGGKYLKSESGERVFFCERDLELFLRKLGLARRYRADKRSARLVFDRMLKIYTDLGYILRHRIVRSKGGSGKKLQLWLSLGAFPHLNHTSHFAARSAQKR